MPCTKQKIVSLTTAVIIISALISSSAQADYSSLAKNDALPVFSTLDPHTYLQTKEKLRYKDVEWIEKKHDHAGLSISAFAQNADRGKTIKGEDTFVAGTPTGTVTIIELGDLTGRTSMIALLFGALPQGQTTFPGGNTGFLQTAAATLFPGQAAGTIDQPKTIDPKQEFGYFSFPLDYRKRGGALDISWQFYKDFGVRFQTRIGAIRQVVQDRINLTDKEGGPDSFGGLQKTDVDNLLMLPLDDIAREIGLDIGNFVHCTVEEIRFSLFWRHAIELNKDEDPDEWAHFLLIPFFEFTGSVSPGKKKDPNQLFALPFGNNGHHSIGFAAGMNFDFLETIEVGGEFGFSHFFKRKFTKFRVPTSQFQTTIFPFTTDVEIKPGHSWHFGAKISALHFLDKLSMHFEWFVIEHKQDSITLQKPDPAFLPGVLEKTTSFKTKLANIGFNYDISPNIGLGFLWQTPFSQRNSYRSTTIMFGFNATF